MRVRTGALKPGGKPQPRNLQVRVLTKQSHFFVDFTLLTQKNKAKQSQNIPMRRVKWLVELNELNKGTNPDVTGL